MTLQLQQLRPLMPSAAATPELVFQVLEVCVHNHTCPTFDISDPRLLTVDSQYDGHARFNQHLFHKQGPGVVYLFGVTEAGHSVCCKVTNFQPWFYIELTPQVTLSGVRMFVAALKKQLQVHIEVGEVERKRVYGWVPASETDVHTVKLFKFAHLSFPTVAAMMVAANKLKEHNESAGFNTRFPYNMFNGCRVDVSEVKVQPSEKCLSQRQLQASGWVRIAAADMSVTPMTDRCTVAQLEWTCSLTALHPVVKDKIAPIVVAAVDIEVQSGDFRSFPDATNAADCCTYIGTTFWVYGDTEPRLKVMQVLGSCDPVEGMVVESYSTELELLEAWRDLIALRGDPDKVVSYNGTGFDYAYLHQRYELLRGGVQRYSRFPHLGRLLFEPTPLKTRELSSAAMGQNEISSFPMTGRWQMDLFQYIKTNCKLASYKLDDVCKHFLSSRVEQASKIVLDYPEWVALLSEDARVEVCSLLAPYPQLDAAVVVSHFDSAVRAAAHPLELAGDKEEKEEMLVVEEGEEEEDEAELAPEAASRWMHVHRHLGAGLNALSKLLQQLPSELKTDAFRREVQQRLDTHVHPALDASGTDNYKKLFRLYVHSAGARAMIAKYCQVDCDLVLYLMDRVSVLPNTVQMSQVTNTLLGDISNRGQQIKTFNLIARYASTRGYVMNWRDVGWDPNADYEGATVLPPQPGYYQRPVATLDFASLYPSIMQAYNLCFSSIVLDAEYEQLEASGARYGRYEIAGKTWVFQEHVKGLLPDILADLVAARRECKKDMAKCEKGSLDYKLADGKQLALKVSCNSVYGFTGALATGMFPCMPVAVATTYNGRNLIGQTKAFAEREYGATVIYGDTDSVMLQFPNVDTVHQAFTVAQEVAARCSALYRDVVQLEFEKVYMPYLLIKKKHYAGIKYEGSPDDPPTLDAKGLALVRRDNCKLVRDTMREVLIQAMRNNNPLAAYECVKAQVQRLVNREVSVEELQISNFLRKDLKSDNHPHVQVVKNMVARGAFGVPRVGDRVPYCIVEGASDKLFERAEHPDYIVEAGLKIDLNYYLRNQLQQRLEKVLQPLPIPDEKKLFDDAAREVQRLRTGTARLDAFSSMFTSVAREARVLPPPSQPSAITSTKRLAPVGGNKGNQTLASMLPVAAANVAVDRVVKKRKKEDGLKQQSLASMFGAR
jgi:DNA polymerase elongation subunit (family B)